MPREVFEFRFLNSPAQIPLPFVFPCYKGLAKKSGHRNAARSLSIPVRKFPCPNSSAICLPQLQRLGKGIRA
jgi:hypothetical protein